MNKLSVIACSIITLLSCTKSSSVVIYSENNFEEISGHAFCAYNLKGDGTSDDTQRLQKLLNDSSTIYLRAGVYLINQTLNFKPNTKLIGQKGTIIKAGKSMGGTLLAHGRYIFAKQANNSLIENIKFIQSENPYSFKEWANACIFILDTQNFEVRHCNFDFHLNYGKVGMEAVWVSGTDSKKNIINGNEINTLGIRYAENGADSTVVDANILTKAYSNALTATGNHPSNFILGCKVLNNKVLNAGRMGIEDWGNTDGTLIRGNSIDGTGKDPNQAIDGIALSAVGTNTSVVNNVIKHGKVYGVEVRGNYGVRVSGNKIYGGPAFTGIILNYTFPAPADKLPISIVEKNTVSGALIGMHVFGNYESNAIVRSNSFTNNLSKGVSIESGAKNYLIQFKDNHFKFSVPNTQDRFAIFSYTKYPTGTANQQLILIADTISFLPSAAAGKGVDFGVVIRTDNAKVENLQVRANNNKNAANVPVNAITAFGAKPANVIFKNNHVFGGLVDLKGFKNLVLSGNNFVQ
ncbi:hypothetical protein ABIB40_002530 [Pedobacter sp. UYP30]|uniref:right-handed parallel beta-helix repeat-containing protein n=1 Tax=Pedobacter sp. UYP30 TaxID=1756400 RepID=UPI003390A579